jgi:hypothetical protein
MEGSTGAGPRPTTAKKSTKLKGIGWRKEEGGRWEEGGKRKEEGGGRRKGSVHDAGCMGTTVTRRAKKQRPVSQGDSWQRTAI